MEIVNTLCNIVMAVCAIVGLGAILIAKSEYNHNRSKESAERAIEMAKYFMDEILPGLSVINKVCQNKNVYSILTSHKFYEYDDFDSDELRNLFDSRDVEKITDVFKNTDISNRLTCENESDKEEKIKLGLLASLLLNKMEYMCMYIASEIADDGYIYNSLHQMFLSSIQILYINIAIQNVNEKDKYYTNIIEVYNKWKERYLTEAEKEEILSQQLDEKIREVKKNFKKNKKIN